MNLEKKELNIKWCTLKTNEDYEITKLANLLSIYSQSRFEIDGIKVESIAGFIVGIQFSEENRSRKNAFNSWGYGARVLARKINKKIESISWNGKIIPRDSTEYYNLIEKAIKIRFERYPNDMKALLSTEGLTLTNKDGPEKKYALLPSEKFCEIITKVRKEFVKKYKLFFYPLLPSTVPCFKVLIT